MSPRTVRVGPARAHPPPRQPHPSRRSASTASSANGHAALPPNASSVRRNLFQSHLARRPTSDASSTSTRSTTILENPFGGPGGGGRIHGPANGNGNGGAEYGSDEASTARLSPGSAGGRSRGSGSGSGGGGSGRDRAHRDEADDFVVRGANGEYAVSMPALPVMVDEAAEGFGGAMDEEHPEVEGQLLEMLNSRTRHSSEAEILEAVRASLRKKVDALEDDRWIYEGDDVLKP